MGRSELDALDERLINACKKNGIDEDHTVCLCLMRWNDNLDVQVEEFLDSHEMFTWEEIFEHLLEFCPDVELDENE